MIDKKVFKKTMAAPFEGAGFTKKGHTWYLDGKDVLIVTNLQKSDWDDMYYLNIGFWLKELGEAVFPPVNRCHLYFRAENLFPERLEILPFKFSSEENFPNKLEITSQFIAFQLIPFLRECTNERKLRELLVLGKLNNGLVLNEARQYLSKMED